MADFEGEIAHISFFLGKEGKTFETILDYKTHSQDLKRAKSIEFTAEQTNCCFIYFLKKTTKTSPPWLDFINEKLSDEDTIQFQASSQNPNGILLLEINKRIFVATFGRSAASYLNKKALEPDFGIKTAMNMCGNEEVRQTKSQSHAITTTHIDRQVNKPADTFAFGLSESEDLSYISAHMRDNKNITLQGRNSLTIKVIGKDKLNWERLIQQCFAFLEAYARKDYLDLFPNYKNFDEASEVETELLDQELLNIIKTGQLNKITLGIPEFLSDNNYGFSYSNHTRPNNNIYAYLDPSQLPENFKLEHLTIRKLRNANIFAYSFEDNRILGSQKWSVYDCISFEKQLNQNYFVLSDGRWLKVDNRFYENIIAFMNTTLREEPCEDIYKNIDISDHAAMQNREEIFNKSVISIRPSCILFDKAKLKIGLGRKDKEFCDILDMTDNKHIRIIHCKPYKDSSSTNYLFSQAKFYCDAFIHDQNFLTEIRNYISESTCPEKDSYLDYIKELTAEINGSDYTVCLWLLHNKNEITPSKMDIPLMAQYELMLMHHLLRNTCKFRDIIIRFIPVQKTNYIKKK